MLSFNASQDLNPASISVTMGDVLVLPSNIVAVSTTSKRAFIATQAALSLGKGRVKFTIDFKNNAGVAGLQVKETTDKTMVVSGTGLSNLTLSGTPYSHSLRNISHGLATSHRAQCN